MDKTPAQQIQFLWSKAQILEWIRQRRRTHELGMEEAIEKAREHEARMTELDQLAQQFENNQPDHLDVILSDKGAITNYDPKMLEGK